MGRHAKPYPILPWGWRSMWVIAMFDLPTETKAARQAYSVFRKSLLNDGFTMMQYSVYIRHCASIVNAETHMKKMGASVPSQGEVRFMMITDRQYGMIRVFIGKKRAKPMLSPAQLELF